jgi:hypothetical protein
VAAAAVAGLVGAGAILWVNGPRELSAAASAPTATSGSSAPVGSPPVPTGFAACGALLCPAGPMCWRGLVQQGDRPVAPAPEDCTAPHYWETYAAMYVPDDVTTDHQLTSLMERADVAAACSAKALAERSRNPALTQGWRRDAWPVRVDAYTLLVHCLAGSLEGESVGAVFRSG